MGILEKLRPTPRWKHGGPGGSRRGGVRTGPEEGEALRALAREDGEARVRRAAVTRLDDVAVLGEIARTDPDEDVRAEAIRNLAGLATEADDVDRADRDRPPAAWRSGARRKWSSSRARARNPDVRAAVVDLIDDQKSLGSVSRHAPGRRRPGCGRWLASPMRRRS